MPDKSIDEGQLAVLEMYHAHRKVCIAEVEEQITRLRTSTDATTVTRDAALLHVLANRVSDDTMLIASTHLGYKTEFAARAIDIGAAHVAQQITVFKDAVDDFAAAAKSSSERADEASRSMKRATWWLVFFAFVQIAVVLYGSFHAQILPPQVIVVPAARP